MHLSMLCPTYPKSGQVGDVVKSWYQDFVARGGDFVLSLYFVIFLPRNAIVNGKVHIHIEAFDFLC